MACRIRRTSRWPRRRKPQSGRPARSRRQWRSTPADCSSASTMRPSPLSRRPPKVRCARRRGRARGGARRWRLGGHHGLATMIAAHAAGISVFATGGIGGVHHGALAGAAPGASGGTSQQPTFDISSDLEELGRTPVAVVCAGPKAILDVPATLEYLETRGVPRCGRRPVGPPGLLCALGGDRRTQFRPGPRRGRGPRGRPTRPRSRRGDPHLRSGSGSRRSFR